MRWPWVSRVLHDAVVQAEQDRAMELAEQLNYWRARAEKLIDTGLARTGAIHEPTMREMPPPKPQIAASLISAMAMTEFDSRLQ